MTAALLSIAACAVLASAILLAEHRFVRTQVKAISAIALVYLVSAVGPALAFVTGYEIYSGVIVDRIGDSLVLSILVLSGMLAGVLFAHGVGGMSSGGHDPLRKPSAQFRLVGRSMLQALSLVMLLVGLTGIGFLGGDKSVAIERLGVLHYQMILAWLCFFVVYYAAEFRVNRTVLFSVASFVVYCLAFHERDFIFPMILILLVAYGQKIFQFRRAIPAIVALLLLVYLLALGRGGGFDAGFYASILYQGSNLFVNSFTLDYMSAGGDYLMGATYLEALLDALTFGVLGSADPLSSWLVTEYRGVNVRAGYGFSLESEAYMNFGGVGVFLLFFAMSALIVRSSAADYLAGYKARLFVCWALIFFSYGLRNESLTLIKSGRDCALVVLAWLIGAAIIRPNWLRKSSPRIRSAHT